MGDMLALVARGTAFKTVDMLLNKHRAEARKYLNGDDKDLIAAIDAGAKAFGESEIDHIKNHWFSDGPASWFTKKSETSWEQRADILRQAYAEAVDLADQSNLQICTYWLCPGSDRFEASVMVSEHQVTVLVFTPHHDDMHRIMMRRVNRGGHQLGGAPSGHAGHGVGGDNSEYELDPDKVNKESEDEPIWIFGVGKQLRKMVNEMRALNKERFSHRRDRGADGKVAVLRAISRKPKMGKEASTQKARA